MNTKERIIKSCQSLIADSGYRGFSMDQLAEKAGVSKRTLYRHFPGRDSVIEASLDQFLLTMGEISDQLIREISDPTELFSSIISHLSIQGQFILNPRSMDELRRYYPHLWAKIDRFRTIRFSNTFAHFAAQEPAGFQAGINMSIAGQVIISAIQGVLNPDFLLANHLSFQQAARELTQILFKAFFHYPTSPPERND